MRTFAKGNESMYTCVTGRVSRCMISIDRAGSGDVKLPAKLCKEPG